VNAPSTFPLGGDGMQGRRVLALLPVSRKERAIHVIDILEAAKARWNVTVDIMCQPNDRKPYETLVAPSGKLFSPPPLLDAMNWEHDPAQAAAVQRRIREAELAHKLPTGRNLLAAAHSIGRGFNAPLRYANRYPLILKITSDNEEPFRIMRRLFVFAERVLDEARPDFLIAYDWAIPLHASFWMAANMRGIPCIAIRNSKVHSNRFFWTADRQLMNINSIRDADARRHARTPLSEAAAKYLQAFRDKPKTVAYIAARWGDRAKRGFVRWHVEFVRAKLREMRNTVKGQDLSLRELDIVRLYRYYRGLYLSYRQRGFFTAMEPKQLENTKYIYFPMHKEAEIAQTFQATPWHDQRNTIRFLASILPAGYRLLAREHRLNFSVRPTQVYKDLAQLPNVTLVNPFDTQFKYIQNADLVVTENGSTGWEALVLGRRLVTVSRCFYDGADLGTKVWDPEKLNQAILAALAASAVADQAEHDKRLGHVIDAEKVWTFAGGEKGTPEALELLVKTVGPLLPPEKMVQARAVNS
jgi:hypothetical protein